MIHALWAVCQYVDLTFPSESRRWMEIEWGIFYFTPWTSFVASITSQGLHPRKLTWNPKTEVWKMIFLFKGVIFQFHVSFRGSALWSKAAANTKKQKTCCIITLKKPVAPQNESKKSAYTHPYTPPTEHQTFPQRAPCLTAPKQIQRICEPSPLYLK